MTIPSVSGTTSNLRQPAGLPCPQCGKFIEMRIEDLLRRSFFRCKQCGLELTLNRAQSRDSLDALDKLQGAIETLNSVKSKYKEKPDGQ